MSTTLLPNPDQLSYDVQNWRRGYRSQPQEFDYWIEDIEGQIPTGLQGTLFRNGPGLLDINGQRIRHPFDGDGLINAIAFSDGRAHFRSRFVRTEGYVAEQAAGKILYRGVFGTQKPGGWLANVFDLKLKNIANTQVIYWGGKLLALWEAAGPHRLDPKTLETLGLEDFAGQLPPGQAFSAHPRLDPSCHWRQGQPVLVNFSISPGLSTAITVYEIDINGQLVDRHTHSVPGFAFIHDFVITPNYCVFFQNPVRFNPLPYVFGWRGAGECVQFRAGQPTRVVVIPRQATIAPGSAASSLSRPSYPVQTLGTKAGFVFHHVNAFEQLDEKGDEQIVVDSVCYEEFPKLDRGMDYQAVDFSLLPPGQLWRFTLNLKTQAVHAQLLEPRCCEFPTVHPQFVGRPHRYAYLGAAHAPTGNAPLQALLKVDLQSGDRKIWSAAPDGFAGEPVFVPRGEGAEDDGWLLMVVYDSAADRSQVVILDAQMVEKGPIARLQLKHHIPYGLHGTFAPEIFL